MKIQPVLLKFRDKIIFLRAIFVLTAATFFTLLLLTDLAWTQPLLFAMIASAVSAILSGMMLIFVDCPACRQFHYVAQGEPIKIQKLVQRALLQNTCVQCGKDYKDAAN